MAFDLKAALKAKAINEGFAQIGICSPDAAPELSQRLNSFVAAGRHGQMGWMAKRMRWRGDPSALWPEVKSIIMLAEPYTPDHDPLEALHQRDRAAISVYAQNRDYHDIVKKRLKRVGRWLVEKADCQIKVFVDTAPVMEKPLAAAAGLGWQGKHTNLLSRDLGNWFFLGAIFTNHPFEPDPPAKGHCGSCRACLEICPTKAFPAPYQLDARLCISYLTIEHKGPIPIDLRPKLGNRIYGCDDCLAVCPWNKFAQTAKDMRYSARPDLLSPPLESLARLNDEAFRTLFSGSPIKRIGRNRFVRNVLYAIGNSGNSSLRSVALDLSEDVAPEVADAARWAVEQLDHC